MSLGFANIADATHATQEVPSVTPAASNAMDADMPPVPATYPSISGVHRLPYTVEEPEVPEVNMKTSSWYEPEPDRIVITDMDSFTQEDEEEDERVSINPALLDRIRSNTIESSTTTPGKPAPRTSQALVLFKPLPLGEREAEIRKMEEDRKEKEAVERKQVIADEDAMDVED